MVRRSARLGAADAALKKTSTAQSKNAATKPEAKPVAQVKSEAKVRSSTGKKRRRGLEDQQPSTQKVKASSAPSASASSSVEAMRTHEREAVANGAKLVAGVDEAGRGPLAGPVVAAACHVPLDLNTEWLDRINDSKGVKEEEREELYEKLIATKGVVWASHAASADRIDEINILQATMECMHNAVAKLTNTPDYVLIDGNRSPWGHPEAVRANGTVRPADPHMPRGVKEGVPVVKGDAKVLSIAAASIIAKVTRDRIMRELDEKHPEYGFGKHKGYGVATHMSAIHKSGPIPGVHRYTFAPLKGSAAAKKHLGSKGATVTQAPKPKPKKKQTKRKGRK
eukprot:gene1379-19821_t